MPFVFSATATLATLAVFATLAGLGFNEISTDGEVLPKALNWVAATVAAVATAVCVMRWRLVRDRSAAWVGVGLFFYGVLKVGLIDTVLDTSRELPIVPSAGSTARALAVIAFVIPLIPWLRRRSRQPQLLFWLSAVVLAGATYLLRLIPDLGESLVDQSFASSSASTTDHAGLAAIWAVLAVGYLRNGRSRQSQLHMWMGGAFGALVLSRLTLAAVPEGSIWVVASGTFCVLAMLFAFLGCNDGLRAAFVEQREQLTESLLAAEVAERRRQAEVAAAKERAHDIRSALLAVDATARALEVRHDDLSPSDRALLAQALTSELRRIQRLVVEGPQEALRRFGLREVLLPVVVCEWARGTEVCLDVDEQVHVIGSDTATAEVVRNLLDNAARYAPGSPVRLTTQRRGDMVVLLISDAGPGVPYAERDRIFEWGVRGSTADAAEQGSGLGLHISSRLMADQGGELWLETRPGRGAAFALSLPAAPDADAVVMPFPAPPGEHPRERAMQDHRTKARS